MLFRVKLSWLFETASVLGVTLKRCQRRKTRIYRGRKLRVFSQ
jgi:hypothetical protein